MRYSLFVILSILSFLSCTINASPIPMEAHSEDERPQTPPPAYHEDTSPPPYDQHVGQNQSGVENQHWLHLLHPPQHPGQEHSPLCHEMGRVQYAWTHSQKRRIKDLLHDEVYELESPFKTKDGTHTAFIRVIRGEFTKEDLIDVQNLSRVQLLLGWAHEGSSKHYIVVKQIGKFAQDAHLPNQQLQDLMRKGVATFKKKYNIYLTDLFSKNDRNFTFGKDTATPISWPPDAVRYTGEIPRSSEGEAEKFC